MGWSQLLLLYLYPIHMNLRQIYGPTMAFTWLCDVLCYLIGELYACFLFLGYSPFCVYMYNSISLVSFLYIYLLGYASEWFWNILFVFHVYILVYVTLMLYIFNSFIYVLSSRIIAIPSYSILFYSICAFYSILFYSICALLYNRTCDFNEKYIPKHPNLLICG